jgi:hypothetical protein
MPVQKVEISSIIVDEKIQQRANLNEEYIVEMSKEIAEGAVLPPLDVYDINGDFLLTDGFHRLMALIKAGVDTVEVKIYEGTERDAILHAVGANANHGLRRTNADKRKAVLTLLEDTEWQLWSDTEIARRIVVTQPFVSKVRRELTQNGFECDTVRKCADGRLVDTSNIGAKRKTEESWDTGVCGGYQSLAEMIRPDENQELHSSEENDDDSSPDSGSEAVVDVAVPDDGVDESNPADNEYLSIEAESEKSVGQESNPTYLG